MKKRKEKIEWTRNKCYAMQVLFHDCEKNKDVHQIIILVE